MFFSKNLVYQLASFFIHQFRYYKFVIDFYPVEFEPFSKIHISSLLGKVGVYILWDTRAHNRPTYIGEGLILERFCKHRETFGTEFDGYVGVTGDTTRKYYKEHGELLEAVLLWISERIGKFPTRNKQKNYKSPIESQFKESERVLNCPIIGADFFEHPDSPKNLRKKEIKISRKNDNYFLLEHPWKKFEDPILGCKFI